MAASDPPPPPPPPARLGLAAHARRAWGRMWPLATLATLAGHPYYALVVALPVGGEASGGSRCVSAADGRLLPRCTVPPLLALALGRVLWVRLALTLADPARRVPPLARVLKVLGEAQAPAALAAPLALSALFGPHGTGQQVVAATGLLAAAAASLGAWSTARTLRACGGRAWPGGRGLLAAALAGLLAAAAASGDLGRVAASAPTLQTALVLPVATCSMLVVRVVSGASSLAAQCLAPALAALGDAGPDAPWLAAVAGQTALEALVALYFVWGLVAERRQKKQRAAPPAAAAAPAAPKAAQPEGDGAPPPDVDDDEWEEVAAPAARPKAAPAAAAAPAPAGPPCERAAEADAALLDEILEAAASAEELERLLLEVEEGRRTRATYSGCACAECEGEPPAASVFGQVRGNRAALLELVLANQWDDDDEEEEDEDEGGSSRSSTLRSRHRSVRQRSLRYRSGPKPPTPRKRSLRRSGVDAAQWEVLDYLDGVIASGDADEALRASMDKRRMQLAETMWLDEASDDGNDEYDSE